MSVSTTRTCRSRSNARYSATVSAMRGVRIRSITGSSAVFRKSTASPAATRSSERCSDDVGVGVGDAHPGEHDHQIGVTDMGLRRDLGGELEVGQPTDREDRQLLASHERGHGVDRRHPRDDRVERDVALGRVDRRAIDRPRLAAQDRRPTVDRIPATVAGASQPVVPDRDRQRPAEERDTVPVGPDTSGSLEHLDHRPVGIDIDDHTMAELPGREPDVDGVVPTDVTSALDDDERTIDAADHRVLHGQVRSI